MFYAQNPLAHQTESVLLPFPGYAVYDAVLAAVNQEKGYKLQTENRMMGRITFYTKASLFSWGEILTVQLEDRSPQCLLTISAQPKTAIGSQAMGAQATIGRKVKKDIDDFLSCLSRYLR